MTDTTLPARHAKACETMAPPPAAVSVREFESDDGRKAYPDVVQYQVKRWDPAAQEYALAEVVELPPTAESHPDDHARAMAERSGKAFRPCSLPYVTLVHDQGIYDRLRAQGALDIGHRLTADAARPTDHRAAPGA